MGTILCMCMRGWVTCLHLQYPQDSGLFGLLFWNCNGLASEFLSCATCTPILGSCRPCPNTLDVRYTTLRSVGRGACDFTFHSALNSVSCFIPIHTSFQIKFSFLFHFTSHFIPYSIQFHVSFHFTFHSTLNFISLHISFGIKFCFLFHSTSHFTPH